MSSVPAWVEGVDEVGASSSPLTVTTTSCEAVVVPSLATMVSVSVT